MPPTVRNARPDDVSALLHLACACYETQPALSPWTRTQLESHQRVFPEGQFVAEHKGQIVGYCANLVTRSARALQSHSFGEITARGTFLSHDASGDTLYGAEIMVRPESRGLGIASSLARARLDLARRLHARYCVTGVRLPGRTAARPTREAEAYVREVMEGRREDRALTAQLENGLRVVGLLLDYMPHRPARAAATHLVWENPDPRSEELQVAARRGFAPRRGRPRRVVEAWSGTPERAASQDANYSQRNPPVPQRSWLVGP